MIAQIADAVLFQPLNAIYAFVFGLLPPSVGAGPRLMAFSIAINLILLPVYAQMEKRSRLARTLREQVARDVARMKRYFRGRERYFYIRAVHRQRGYYPMADLTQSADLFVQVFVFATVYRYLAGLDALKGQALGPIPDLGRPDGLLFGQNLLPFLMTAINALAVWVWAGDSRQRVQSLLLGLLFLILLYRSPSGLVLYWTTNNLFSLARSSGERLLRRHAPALFARLETLQAQQ